MPGDRGGHADATGTVIVWALERLGRVMRAEEHGGDLNPAQWETLRYLSRANRISNSPGALTRYLGATKGTISQTVKSLERKGYVAKSLREGEKRSVVLKLTRQGEAALVQDPWGAVSGVAGELGNRTRRRLAKGLREILSHQLKHGNHRSFGQCRSCRFFREKGREDDPLGPHLCMLLDEALTETESQGICVEHEMA